MKIKVLLAILVLTLGITGCSTKEERDLVEEGKVALEKHEYTQAAELLSEALEIDSADEHARAMYMQATRMASASEYEKEQNYKKAIIDLEFIENIKGGSSTIKSEASSKKKELEKLQEEYSKAQQERKQNAKTTSANDTYKREKEALAEYQKQQEEQRKQEEEEKKQEEENNQNNVTTPPEGANPGGNAGGNTGGNTGGTTPTPPVTPTPEQITQQPVTQ